MLRDCYKCRGLFETDNPDRKYCDDCRRDLERSGRLLRFPGDRSRSIWEDMADWLQETWEKLKQAVSDASGTRGRRRGGPQRRPRSRGTSALSGRATYRGRPDWGLFGRLLGGSFAGAFVGHAATIYLGFPFLGTLGGFGGLYWTLQRLQGR